ncbi:fatty acid desaturase [Thiotrichales bacterium 19S9-12]|nr:fatty acid desaturase [Thiotrichales bacterium 19S9-12]
MHSSSTPHNTDATKYENNKAIWQKVHELKSAEVRNIIPTDCYLRSMWLNFCWGSFDILILIIGLTFIFVGTNIIAKLFGGMICGIAASLMFIWAHDAAHGALFKSKKIAEIFGTLFMLPSFSVYRIWSYSHNKVHHGFVALTPLDVIWAPLSPQEYHVLSLSQRILYRIERSFFTCAVHYLRQIWWKYTWKFNPGKNKSQRRYYLKGKLFVLAYILIISGVGYFFADGIIGVIALFIIPLTIFNYGIGFLVYLHHTHTDIPLFKQRAEWSHTIGAIYCCTVIRLPKLLDIILHHIMTHIPHHLDTRIPFYHLPKAYQALKQEYKPYLHEYTFNWLYVFNIFKQCKLYDYEKKLWLTFKEAKLI